VKEAAQYLEGSGDHCESKPKDAALKLPLALSLGLLVSATPALAIEQNCRFIPAKAEREACYAKQEAELAAKRKPPQSAESRDLETMQRMRQEDAEVYRSMRSICRGC
jgi:hypothetical protein